MLPKIRRFFKSNKMAPSVLEFLFLAKMWVISSMPIYLLGKVNLLFY